MLRRSLIAALPLMVLAGAAKAAEKGKDKDKDKAPKEAGQYVDIQTVALPIVVDGQLLNYVFVNVRINLTAAADAANLRAREPFFRDALVRAGHRTPFVLASDYQKVDEAKLTAALTRDAIAIAGPGMIHSVVVSSQAPQRRVATPRPAPPARS
jgi:hypothetical protein